MTIRSHFMEELNKTITIVITVFFHALLFVLWILLDNAAAYVVQTYMKDGSWIAQKAFHILASLGIFCAAGLPILADIIEALGFLKRKFTEVMSLPCSSCPSHDLEEEK